MNPFGTLVTVPTVLSDPLNEGDIVRIHWRERGQTSVFFEGDFRIDSVDIFGDHRVVQGFVRYDGINFNKAIIMIDELGNGEIEIEEIWV